MPTVTTDDGVMLQYECSGGEERGGDDRPTIAFISDVGFGPWVGGWQAPGLSGPYRTLVYGVRGTDGSGESEPYNIDRFAADLDAVLSAAGRRRVHLVGAGVGGMVALRYAREYGRARSLTLFGVAATGNRIDKAALSALHPSNPEELENSLSVGFTDEFLAETGLTEQITAWRRDEDATGSALSGHKSAALEFEAGPLYELTIPALVCHGVDDPVVSLDAGEELAADLPRGRFEPVEGKRCCYIEHAAAVTDAIDGFVEGVEAAKR